MLKFGYIKYSYGWLYHKIRGAGGTHYESSKAEFSLVQNLAKMKKIKNIYIKEYSITIFSFSEFANVVINFFSL